MKQDNVEGKFATNKDCHWCHGSGFITIPNYGEIGKLNLWQAILDEGWVFKPTMSTYCHMCYANGTPLNLQKKRYATLLQSLNYAKFAGAEYYDLMLSCLLWTLTARHTVEYANKLLSDLLRSMQ